MEMSACSAPKGKNTMSESAVVVRFGGDVGGLDAAVAVAKAQLAGFNSEVRKLAKEAAASGGAVNENLSKALREAAAGAAGMQKELKSLTTKPLSDATTDVQKLHKSLDGIGDFTWKNTSLSGDEIDRVINPIKGIASAFGVLPTVALAASAAAALAIYKIAERAHEVRTAVKSMSDELSLSGEINIFQGSFKGGQKLVEQATHIESAWDLMGKGAALSTDEAKKFGTELAKLPGLTETMARGFTDLARDERYAFGADGLAAVQGLATALRKPDEALKTLLDSNLRLVPAQRQAAQSSLESGNAQKQASTYFQLVTDDLIRQKSEAVLLEESQSALGGTIAKVASEALDAARASGDFAGALATLAEAGSSAARKLMGMVSAIGSIRSEMARGLGGVELSNALQNTHDKLFPLATEARSMATAWEASKAQVAGLSEELSKAQMNAARVKASGGEGSAEFTRASNQVADLNRNLELAKQNADAFGDKARKANDALKGGTGRERAFKDIEATHGAGGEGGDRDKVAESREKIEAIMRESAGLGATEDAVAKRRELDEKLATELKNLSDAQKEVTVARIDAEIAEEEKGSAKKKELLRKKFEVETKGVAPNSADYIGKASALKTALEEEPDAAKAAKAPKENSDALNAARKDIDGQIEAVKQQTTLNKQQYELDAANKKITEDQKKALVSQADDQELVSIKALYEQEKQIDGQKPAQIQEINNKIEALESQHTLKMVQEQTKAAQESAKVWNEEAKQMAGTLTSSLSQAIEGAVEHTKTKDAGKKLAQSLFNELTSDLVKEALANPLETALAPMFKGLTSLVTQPLQEGLKAAFQPISSSITGALGGAAGGAVDAAGGAALTGAATALTAAATALSAAAATLGAGGAAAGAGGAVASGGGFFSALAGLLPAFDVGSFQLPSLGNFDGKGGFPALVHPGEMIVPAGPAGPLRQALKGGGVGSGAGGSRPQSSGDFHLHLSSNDSQDAHRWLTANQRQVAKAYRNLVRNGAGLGQR
jgi:hypothetical protein